MNPVRPMILQSCYENSDNLIGKYIEAFSGCSEDSVEYQAMCEGVEALLENKGQQE